MQQHVSERLIHMNADSVLVTLAAYSVIRKAQGCLFSELLESRVGFKEFTLGIDALGRYGIFENTLTITMIEGGNFIL